MLSAVARGYRSAGAEGLAIIDGRAAGHTLTVLMTDPDFRLLLAVAAEAAGMIALAWMYACYRYPVKVAQRLTDESLLVSVPQRSEEDRAA
jgi:hypothetical protein